VSDVLYFNGRFTTTDERVLRVEDRGFLFGDAIYEVFKFLRKRPVFLDDHWRRLAKGLNAIDIRNPWTAESFASTMGELLDRTSFDDGIVYIEVSRGEGERAHFFAENMTPTAAAFSRRYKFPDAAKKERGIRLISDADLRWKHCDVKSVNLLPNALSKKKAQRAGGDEVLFIDGEIVRECGSSSFFIVKNGHVITHPLDCHILPGVTRDRVIDLARDLVDEREIRVEELADADEIFITSTTLGVMPVNQIDDKTKRVRGPITADLQHRLEEAESA
jgi:D-alanine transaminase